MKEYDSLNYRQALSLARVATVAGSLGWRTRSCSSFPEKGLVPDAMASAQPVASLSSYI